MKVLSRALASLSLIWIVSISVAQASTTVHIPNRAAAAPPSPFILVSVHAKTLVAADASAADKAATRGTVSADKKTLVFRQKSVRLLVQTGPENDMLSYRINGLRNPAIVVPRGATLKVLFVNTDGDMFHNVRFGAWRSNFPNAAGSLIKTSVGTTPTPHVQGAVLHGVALVIKAPTQPGRYTYFCTVRGHAQGGMWGTIEVR